MTQIYLHVSLCTHIHTERSRDKNQIAYLRDLSIYEEEQSV